MSTKCVFCNDTKQEPGIDGPCVWCEAIASTGGKLPEVHRYSVVRMLSEEGNVISYNPHGPEVVMASTHDAHIDRLQAEREALQQLMNDRDEQLDAQRLRADTAEAELAKMTADRDSLKGIASAYIASDGAKDLQIIAAEQRIAEREELLREVLNEVPHGWGDSFSNSELAERIRAALNPKPEAGSHE